MLYSWSFIFFLTCIPDLNFAICIFLICISRCVFPFLYCPDFYVAICMFSIVIFRLVFPDWHFSIFVRFAFSIYLPIYTFRPVFVLVDLYLLMSIGTSCLFRLESPIVFSDVVGMIFPIRIFWGVFSKLYFPICIISVCIFRIVLSGLYSFNAHFLILQHFGNCVFLHRHIQKHD